MSVATRASTAAEWNRLRERSQAASPTVSADHRIIVDSLEKLGYTFEGIRAGADQGHAIIKVELITRRLSAADYAVDGLEHLFRVERKSKQDLGGTLAWRREPFTRELERLGDECRSSAVVVETSFADLVENPPSRMSVRSLVGTITAFMVRFPKTQWLFAGDRRYGETLTYRLLERVHRDHEKTLKAG